MKRIQILSLQWFSSWVECWKAQICYNNHSMLRKLVSLFLSGFAFVRYDRRLKSFCIFGCSFFYLKSMLILAFFFRLIGKQTFYFSIISNVVGINNKNGVNKQDYAISITPKKSIDQWMWCPKMTPQIKRSIFLDILVMLQFDIKEFVIKMIYRLDFLNDFA